MREIEAMRRMDELFKINGYTRIISRKIVFLYYSFHSWLGRLLDLIMFIS